MNYAQIRQYDVANGPGIRCTFFVTGCSLKCKNCFNQEYQDPAFGQKWTEENTSQIIDYLKSDLLDGLTILGGEPFESAPDLLEVIREIRKASDKSIWIFSGYTFDKLIEDETRREILKLCDVLVDGRFVDKLKNLKLKFRGSSNQRLIDLKKTFERGEVVLVDEDSL
ncbi:MAG: anaerobic ribonucleoside-triphosphate reductase activating protein [Finegoldia sp.]|nr:anaerobic ribonucleoside-triphosphate reductase activating protein [Finegoldia sp.]